MSTKAPAASPAAKVEETVDEWHAKIERLRSRKPAEAWLTIPDPEALVAVEVARGRWLEARIQARGDLPDAGSLSAAEVGAFLDDVPEVQARYAELEAAIETAQDREVTFHFRTLPPDVYDVFQLKHPPTEEQKAEGMTYNPDSYLPAVIAASSVKPLTAAQVADLITAKPDPDDPDVLLAPAFNQGDVAAMHQTIRDLNERPRMMLGKGSRPTPD